MNFTFIRHGQTDATLYNFICGGGWDVPLNSTGRVESQTLALRLKKSNQLFSFILASPLLRSKETAEIISELLKIPIIYSDLFNEQNLGSWEKQPVRQYPFFTIKPSPPAGERYSDFSDRIASGLKNIIENKSDKNILIISHGLVWREICEQLKLKYVPAQRCTPYFISNQENTWSFDMSINSAVIP